MHISGKLFEDLHEYKLVPANRRPQNHQLPLDIDFAVVMPDSGASAALVFHWRLLDPRISMVDSSQLIISYNLDIRDFATFKRS